MKSDSVKFSPRGTWHYYIPPSIMVLFLQQLYQTRHPDIAMSSDQFSLEVKYHYKQF